MKWISVKEELPPIPLCSAMFEGHIVWMGFVIIGYWYPVTTSWRDHNTDKDITDKVTHWMPLPNDPKRK